MPWVSRKVITEWLGHSFPCFPENDSQLAFLTRVAAEMFWVGILIQRPPWVFPWRSDFEAFRFISSVVRASVRVSQENQPRQHQARVVCCLLILCEFIYFSFLSISCGHNSSNPESCYQMWADCDFCLSLNMPKLMSEAAHPKCSGSKSTPPKIRTLCHPSTTLAIFGQHMMCKGLLNTLETAFFTPGVGFVWVVVLCALVWPFMLFLPRPPAALWNIY